jgi:hypothetical protein
VRLGHLQPMPNVLKHKTKSRQDFSWRNILAAFAITGACRKEQFKK